MRCRGPRISAGSSWRTTRPRPRATRLASRGWAKPAPWARSRRSSTRSTTRWPISGPPRSRRRRPRRKYGGRSPRPKAATVGASFADPGGRGAIEWHRSSAQKQPDGRRANPRPQSFALRIVSPPASFRKRSAPPPLEGGEQPGAADKRRQRMGDDKGRDRGEIRLETPLGLKPRPERRIGKITPEPRDNPTGDELPAAGAEGQRQIAGHRAEHRAKLRRRLGS